MESHSKYSIAMTIQKLMQQRYHICVHPSRPPVHPLQRASASSPYTQKEERRFQNGVLSPCMPSDSKEFPECNIMVRSLASANLCCVMHTREDSKSPMGKQMSQVCLSDQARAMPLANKTYHRRNSTLPSVLVRPKRQAALSLKPPSGIHPPKTYWLNHNRIYAVLNTPFHECRMLAHLVGCLPYS